MRVGCLCVAAGGAVIAVWPLESSARSAGEVRFVGIACAALFGAVGLILAAPLTSAATKIASDLGRAAPEGDVPVTPEADPAAVATSP